MAPLFFTVPRAALSAALATNPEVPSTTDSAIETAPEPASIATTVETPAPSIDPSRPSVSHGS